MSFMQFPPQHSGPSILQSMIERGDRWNWLQSRRRLRRQGRRSATNKSDNSFSDCNNVSEVCGHVPSAAKQWRTLASEEEVPEGRCSHTLTAVSEECLLLVGGGSKGEQEGQFHHYNDVWMLNALTAKWTQVETTQATSTSKASAESTSSSHWGMTFWPPRRGHMAASASVTDNQEHKDYLIVFGGVTDNDVELNDTWILHLASLQWRRVHFEDDESTLPPPRRGAVCFCHDDHFFLVGGHATEAMVLWKLGPLSETTWRWTTQPTFNKAFLHKRAPKWPTVSVGARPLHPLQFASSAIVSDTKLWIFAGLERHPGSDGVVPTSLLYRLDLSCWEWSVLLAPKHCPCPRFFHGMTSIGRFLVVMGGIGISSHDDITADGDDNASFQQRTLFDVYYFDTEALTWKNQSDSTFGGGPCARNAFALARLGNNHLIVHGGGVYPNDYFKDTYALEFNLPPLVVEPFGDSNGANVNVDGNNTLCSDLGSLYQSGLLSDVTFIVGTRQFAVHKAILAARSSFFHSMFVGPYAEATTHQVQFETLNPDAVDVVLRFLYTNHVDTNAMNEEVVSSVLQLVDFWNVTRLLDRMETALGQELDRVADPINLICFAKAHHCHRLALKCLEYCKQHSVKLENVEPDVVEEIHDYINSLI